MLEIVLVQPEIPPNAGNVIRLAANTGARLHLVGPLGFSMDHRQLKRAGLDYHDLANVTVHRAWKEFLKEMAERRMFAFTTKAKRIYADVLYSAGDVLVFVRKRAASPNRSSRSSSRYAAPLADASWQPQPQSLECGGRGGVRSLAPARLSRQHLALHLRVARQQQLDGRRRVSRSSSTALTRR